MYGHFKTGCKHIPPSELPLQFHSGYYLNKRRINQHADPTRNGPDAPCEVHDTRRFDSRSCGVKTDVCVHPSHTETQQTFDNCGHLLSHILIFIIMVQRFMVIKFMYIQYNI